MLSFYNSDEQIDCSAFPIPTVKNGNDLLSFELNNGMHYVHLASNSWIWFDSDPICVSISLD